MTNEISLLPAVYRNDPWLKELFQSAGIVHQRLVDEIIQLHKDLFFDTVSERQLAVEEGICQLSSASNLDTRRSLLEARWKTGGRCGIELLQTICDSWKNGRCIVSFADGTIVLTFNGEFGVPTNIESLMTAIETARPAHLPINYVYAYLMVADAEAMTVDQLEQQTLDKFAFGGDSSA